MELIHSASEAESFRSRTITGRATLTTVASIMINETAKAMKGIAFQRIGWAVSVIM